MSTIISRPALGGQFYDASVVERSVKLSCRGSSMVDVCNLLWKYKVTADEVVGVSGGHPGDEGHTVLFKDGSTIEKISGTLLQYRNKVFHMVALGKQSVTIRVHWLPVFITDVALKSVMSEFGNILNVRRLMTKTDGHVLENGIREVTLEVSELQKRQLPHLIRFDDGMAILLTITGRPPLCLRCSHVGHVSRNCPYDTRFNTANYNKSFADATRSAVKEPSQSAQATGEVRDDAPIHVEVAAQEELPGDRPLVIDVDRAGRDRDGETDEEEFMEAETRGKKRQSYNDEVTDSFQKAFPPQKSMRPSGAPPGTTTYNRYSLLGEESLSQVAEVFSTEGESPGGVLAGLMAS